MKVDANHISFKSSLSYDLMEKKQNEKIEKKIKKMEYICICIRGIFLISCAIFYFISVIHDNYIIPIFSIILSLYILAVSVLDFDYKIPYRILRIPDNYHEKKYYECIDRINQIVVDINNSKELWEDKITFKKREKTEIPIITENGIIQNIKIDINNVKFFDMDKIILEINDISIKETENSKTLYADLLIPKEFAKNFIEK